MGEGGFAIYDIGVFMNVKQAFFVCKLKIRECINRLNDYLPLGPSGLDSPHTH